MYWNYCASSSCKADISFQKYKVPADGIGRNSYPYRIFIFFWATNYKLIALDGRNSPKINVNYFAVFRESSANMDKISIGEPVSIQIEKIKLTGIRSSKTLSDLLYCVVPFNFHVYY